MNTYEKYESLLKERNMTNYQVSKETGIAESVLSSWKSGRSEVKFDKVVILARFFNVPLEYFAEGGEQNG